MTQTVLIRAILTALCLCLSGPAFAQQSETPTTPTQSNKAREWMEKGVAAANKGENEEARRAFLKSFEIYPSFDVAGNLGIADFELRRYMTSAKYLEYCLDHFPDRRKSGSQKAR